MKNKARIFFIVMFILLFAFARQIFFLSLGVLDGYSNFLFSIEHVKNTGSAFGMFSGNPYPLAVFGILVLVLLLFYVFKRLSFQNKLELLACTFFGAGTFGNIFERLSLGHVEDYIKFNFIDFPVFNLFDVYICVGVFLYFLCIFLYKEENENQN
ncbi:signal peptidase II [bacterium]|nr:signal peptidase II [bacterium]